MINYFEGLGFGNQGQKMLQGAQGFQALRANEQAMKQREQQAQRQQQADQQAMLQFQSEQQRQRAAQGAGAFYNALNAGNDQAALALAQEYAQDINSLGDPSFTVDSVAKLMQTPEGKEQLKQMSLGMVQIAAGPEQVARFTAQQAQPERAAPEPARVAEFRRWIELNPDATIEEKRQVYNQMIVPQERAFATGQGSGQARVATEQQLNPVLAERARETAEAQQGTAAGQAALTKAQADAQAAQRKIQEEETRKIQQVDLSRQTAKLAREIAEDPNFERVTGVGTMFPTILPESQDVILKAEQLISLLTADNLKLMSGVLTDRDIQMLSTLSSGMRVTDKGIRGSAPAIRKRLQQIAKNIDEKLGRAEQANSEQQPAQPRTEQDILAEYGLQ